MNQRLQKAGGAAALTAAIAFVFVFILVATTLSQMTEPDLPFGAYLELHRTYGALIYVWHFAMYIVFGLCLIIVTLALHDRFKEGSPTLSVIAAALGLIYSAFVLLGGLLTIHGDAAVLVLATSDPVRAEGLRGILAAITLCVDSSDRLLGCLWVGTASAAAFGAKSFPRSLACLGLAIGAPGIIGMAFPSLLALSYVFGLGIIVWSAWIGVVLLRSGVAGISRN